jgi:nicotinamidase-related amidase
VILTGIAGDNCILLTAADAKMLDLHIHVPPDCTISEDPAENDRAIAYMARQLDVDVTASIELNLTRMVRVARQFEAGTARD